MGSRDPDEPYQMSVSGVAQTTVLVSVRPVKHKYKQGGAFWIHEPHHSLEVFSMPAIDDADILQSQRPAALHQ